MEDTFFEINGIDKLFISMKMSPYPSRGPTWQLFSRPRSRRWTL